MQKVLFIVFFTLSFFFVATTNAQQDTIVKAKPAEKKTLLCQIKMHDGSVYHGFIEKQTDSLLYVKSSSGVTIHVPKNQVSSIDFINGHTTKDSTGNLTIHIAAIAHNYYVASSNAFLMKKGEVYGSSSYFMLYNINYAFNPHFSLGVSTSPLAAPLSLRLKANFEIAHKLYLGVDGLFGSGSWLNSKIYGGGGVLKVTYGDVKTNFTVLGGYGDVDYFVKPSRVRGRSRAVSGHYEEVASLITGAAFSYAISQKLYFVLEAFAIPNISVSNNVNTPQIGVYTLSPAIRTNLKNNFSWVLGLDGVFYTSTNRGGTNNTAFALPYIGFSFRL